MSIALEAMIFARDVHKDQQRKYTGNPYADHLAEVAGIVSTVSEFYHMVSAISVSTIVATAWLHDCMEDHGITYNQLAELFGKTIADGVQWLSDMEEGNRAERKRLSRERLAAAPAWVQSIKVADLISNTASIVQHDPRFARVYLEEKRMLLDVLTKASPELVEIARQQVARSGA